MVPSTAEVLLARPTVFVKEKPESCLAVTVVGIGSFRVLATVGRGIGILHAVCLALFCASLLAEQRYFTPAFGYQTWCEDGHEGCGHLQPTALIVGVIDGTAPPDCCPKVVSTQRSASVAVITSVVPSKRRRYVACPST